MCYQVVELYSQCRCLYYQHAIDRCELYKKHGHRLEKRTIYVGYTCQTHGSVHRSVGKACRVEEAFSTSQDSAYHSASDGQFSQPERETVSGPRMEPVSELNQTSQTSREPKIPFRRQVLSPLPGLRNSKETLEPVQFQEVDAYLCSLRQRSNGLNSRLSQLSQLIVGSDSLDVDLERLNLKDKNCEVSSARVGATKFPHSDSPPPSVQLEPADNTVSSKFRVGSDQSDATNTTFAPSVFSGSAGSLADVSDGLSWSEQEASESDDLSSSAHSGELENGDFAHSLSETRESMVTTLVAGFNSHTRAASESQESSSSRQYSQESSNGPKRSSAKRQQADSDDDAESRPDGPRLAKKIRAVPEHDLLFACVYFKKDPLRYHACGKAGQKRIRDVKQHLRRKHYDPFYCPRCFVSFSTEQQRDEHTRVLDCILLPDQTRDQLSWEQIMALGKKVNHKLTPAMQWFSVWDICFPGRPRPASPFIDPEISEQLSSFRDYYNSNGPGMIFAALSERNLINWSLPNQSRDLAAFGRAVLSDSLDRVFETWLENQRQSSMANEPSATDSVSDESSRLAEQAEVPAVTEADVVEVSNLVPSVLSAQMQQGFGELARTTEEEGNALETPHLLSFPADNFFLEHMGLGSWDAHPDYNFG